MASAAGVAATLARRLSRPVVDESQWPLQPVYCDGPRRWRRRGMRWSQWPLRLVPLRPMTDRDEVEALVSMASTAGFTTQEQEGEEDEDDVLQ